MSLAARGPKRSERRRIPVVNHIGLVCGLFVIARSGGQNRARTRPRLRGGASFEIFGLDNLLHHSRGMIDREEVSRFSISCETRAGVTLHHLDNAIDALAIVENMRKETQLPIVMTNRATGQVLTFEELRRLANLERSRARRS